MQISAQPVAFKIGEYKIRLMHSRAFHTMRTLRRYSIALAVASLVITATGCSDGLPTRVPVSGKVLVDGEPINKGRIMFYPEGGRPAYSKIQQDGSFTLSCFKKNDGAQVGLNRVSVLSRTIISENNVEWYAPSHYANQHTSGIEVEITEPLDDLVIELTSKDVKKRR